MQLFCRRGGSCQRSARLGACDDWQAPSLTTSHLASCKNRLGLTSLRLIGHLGLVAYLAASHFLARSAPAAYLSDWVESLRM